MSQPPLMDLHCHLLPGIDDGSKNIETTMELMRREQEDGVQAVMFTPHFYYERKDLDTFVRDRHDAYVKTARAAAAERLGIAAKLGAEVYFTPALPTLDLKRLAFAGTQYLLIELPTTYHPSGIEETLFEIMQQGYTPILAHVERYPYVTEDPTLLYNWVTSGCLAQINAAGLIRGGQTARMLHRYMKWELVHLLCTDAHSLKHRPPNLKQAHDLLTPQQSERFRRNAEAVFWGREPELSEPHEPKYMWGQWL